MSFRKEEKIFFHKSSFLDLIKFLNKNNAKKLYPTRQIESIYFDNKFFQSYHDSEDSLVPRKKIRIRSYDNFLNCIFETKITSVEGKFKKSNKITTKEFLSKINKGIYDKSYGLLYPVIKISYLRKYFLINNYLRITIDYDVKYCDYKRNNFFVIDKDSLILEVKSDDNVLDDMIKNIIPFNRERVSKYCLGIDKLFNRTDGNRILINI